MLTRAMVVRRRRAQCGEVYDQYPLEAAASGDAMKRSAHTPSSTDYTSALDTPLHPAEKPALLPPSEAGSFPYWRLWACRPV